MRHSFAMHFAKYLQRMYPCKAKRLTRNNEISTTTRTDKFIITLQTCAPQATLQTYHKYFVNFFALYRKCGLRTV